MDLEERELRLRFARWVRKAMQTHGLSVADVARGIERDADWLSRFELGLPGSDLRWDEARDLIILLGGSPDALRMRLIRRRRRDRP